MWLSSSYLLHLCFYFCTLSICNRQKEEEIERWPASLAVSPQLSIVFSCLLLDLLVLCLVLDTSFLSGPLPLSILFSRIYSFLIFKSLCSNTHLPSSFFSPLCLCGLASPLLTPPPAVNNPSLALRLSSLAYLLCSAGWGRSTTYPQTQQNRKANLFTPPCLPVGARKEKRGFDDALLSLFFSLSLPLKQPKRRKKNSVLHGATKKNKGI